MISFAGRHNRSKALVLLLLRQAELGLSPQGLTTWGIINLTGLTPGSAYSLMTRLARWEYVRRRPGNRGCRYRLLAKGRRFIEEKTPPWVLDELDRTLAVKQKRGGQS